MIFFTKFQPKIPLLSGQNEDDLQVFAIFGKAFHCVHQHGSSANRQKLLRHVATHPQALSAGYNHRVIHHFCINWLCLIPSLSDSATSSDSNCPTNS